MLFDAKEFEYYFTESNLKKGLSFFEKGKVDVLATPVEGAHRFLINGTYKVKILKRGDKILSYSCNCRKKIKCEHLSAVLFYFQKETLGLAVKKRKVKKPSESAPKKNSKTPFIYLLNTLPHTQLLDFMAYYERIDPDFKTAAEFYFSDSAGDAAFYYFELRLRALFSEYPEELHQNQLDLLGASLQNLIHQTIQTRDPLQLYYLHLVLFSELPVIFNRRLLGNETQLLKLFYQSQQALDQFFRLGLSSSEKTAWVYVAGHYKAARGLNLEALAFLVPRALCCLEDKKTFLKLRSTLAGYKSAPLYAGQMDKLLIIQWQMAIKASREFKIPLPSTVSKSKPEWIIANAEVNLHTQKVTSAFRLLEKGYEKIKAEHPSYTIAFLEYIILKAREEGQLELELKYIKECMVYNLHIPVNHVNRLFELWPLTSRSENLGQLLTLLRARATPFLEEKVISILLAAGKIEELAAELRNHNKPFALIHKVMFHYLPGYKEEFFPLYATQLIQVLEIKKTRNEMLSITHLVKRYIEQLPEEERRKMILEIVNQAKGQQHVYAFLQTHFA